MTNDSRRIIRDGFGAIEDEMRQARSVNREILKSLKELVKMCGEDNAKVQAIREDIGALQDRNQEHERTIALHSRQLATLAGR